MNVFRAVLIFGTWFVIFPLLCGTVPAQLLYGEKKTLAQIWLNGFFLVLGSFELPAVFLIRSKESLTMLITVHTVMLVLFSIAGIVYYVAGFYKENKPEIRLWNFRELKLVTKVLWGMFFLLFSAQLVQVFLTMTTDGDDAYYIGTALLAVERGRMYLDNPYSGLLEGILDYRHILSPLPMFIAMLSKLSGIHPAILAHTILPLILIPTGYLVCFQLGERLFDGEHEKLPVYMIALLFLTEWGNYSVYTRENFFLTRTWQGKSVLTALVIPMILYLVYLFAEAEEHKKAICGMLFVVNLSAVLCSSMGIMLVPILELVLFGCIAVRRKSLKEILYALVALMPCFFYGAIYFIHKGLLMILYGFYK